MIKATLENGEIRYYPLGRIVEISHNVEGVLVAQVVAFDGGINRVRLKNYSILAADVLIE